MTWLRLLALLLAGVSGFGQVQRLNVFIWSEYLDPAIVRDFEKEFECKVVLDFYEDADSMMAKVAATGGGVYDIMVPSDYLIPGLLKLNLLSPLRLSNIPNFKNLDPRFVGLPYDRENKHTIPYQWGTLGVFARKLEGRPQCDSWASIFDPAQRPGPIVLIDSMRDLFGAMLKYQGKGFNATDPKDLLAARNALLPVKEKAVALDSSVGGRNRVLAKGASAAIVYSGEGARGITQDTNTYYFIPKEGSQIWVDNLVISARAPHRDLAEKFINFMLDPKIGARISNFAQFCTPNRAARPFVNPNLLNNPAIYPPPEVLARLEFLQDLGSKTKLYDELWTQLKTK